MCVGGWGGGGGVNLTESPLPKVQDGLVTFLYTGVILSPHPLGVAWQQTNRTGQVCGRAVCIYVCAHVFRFYPK